MVVNVTPAGTGPASYTLVPGPALLFTSADWIQSVRDTGIEVIPTVLIYDQDGSLMARMEGPAVFVP